MSELVNLIPDPSTAGAYVPRPAAVLAYDFADFSFPGVVSSLVVIGDRGYGTIQTERKPGFDEPFIYDFEAGAIVPFDGVPTGIAAGQLCVLPPSILSIQAFVLSVAGSVVTLNVNLDNNASAGTVVQFFSSLVTLSANATSDNSGVDFTVLGGGEARQFGWWDQSGFEQDIIAAAVGGEPMLTGDFSVLGIQPGMTLVGPGILAGTTVLATSAIIC